MKKTMAHRDELPTVAQENPLPWAVSASKRPSVLELVKGPGAPHRYDLQLDEIIVGRSLQASISLSGSGISRQHIVLTRADGEYKYTDMNSANGVYLNGVKTHSAILRQGDTLQIGEFVFVFHEGT